MEERRFEVTPCKLTPVTPTNISRYSNSAGVQLCPRVISRGPAVAQWCLSEIQSDPSAETRSSPISKWLRFVHPEGQPYFVLTGESAFAVVTEANVEDAHTRDRILDCITLASEALYCLGIKLPSRCELFLELGDDRMSCNYYLVDHVGKMLFWLEDICTDMLDIPPAVSPSHLETELERLYWVHIEYFPMHHEQQQFSRMVEDLYNVISHGQADRLTSRTSTFPYTADTCKQFLELLARKRGEPMDGYTLCYAARLAGAIANQRFVTFYGQKPAQLDRLQEMFAVDIVHHRWMLNVANMLMWGIPLHYINLLDDLYVNEQVYADQWTRFMTMCLADWTATLSWSLPVCIASVLLVNLRGGTLTASTASVLACAVSIASASCLHLRHQPLAESSASVGARYLRFARWSTVGFLPSSVVFSLPRASYLWGVSFLTAQIFSIAFHNVNTLVAMLLASAFAATLVLILYVIYPEDVSMRTLFQSAVSLCIPRFYALDPQRDESMV